MSDEIPIEPAQTPMPADYKDSNMPLWAIALILIAIVGVLVGVILYWPVVDTSSEFEQGYNQCQAEIEETANNATAVNGGLYGLSVPNNSVSLCFVVDGEAYNYTRNQVAIANAVSVKQ